MIILRVWMTKNKRYKRLSGKWYNRYWKGWFLFGIVPLFIVNYKTEYGA